MDDIFQAIQLTCAVKPLLANGIGVALGIIFGALPGLTAAMGVALLLPLTFNLPVAEAFSALLGMYCGAIYGGSITAILIGTPGTVAAAATMLEGPALTARGQSKKALDMATFASFFGGAFSCVALIVMAPMLARVATAFGPAEYFAVAIFGMTVVASLAAASPVKGMLSALLGCYCATMGGDPITGEVRNTYEMTELISGFTLVPVLVGLFAVAQIFVTVEDSLRGVTRDMTLRLSREGLKLRDFFRYKWNMLRSSIIGVIVGIIPATGGGSASYLAYSTAQRYSDTPEEFGKGTLEGIAATESANNASTGGTLIPLLTLGVPGDIVTAIMLGALMIQGLVPGPLLFQNEPQAVYSIFIAFIISNVLMLIIGLSAVRSLSNILRIPPTVLMPCVMTLCIIGAWAVNTSAFDLYTVVIFGVLGYLMHKVGMPAAPLLLSMILSPIAETNFRRAIIVSNGDYSVFFTSYISLGLLLVSAAVAAKTVWNEVQRRRHLAASQTEAS